MSGAASITGVSGPGAVEGPFRGFDLRYIYKTGVGLPGRYYGKHMDLPLSYFAKNNLNPPSDASFGNLQVYSFDHLGTDHVHAVIKVPYDFISNFRFHVHWTKTQSTSQTGKTAQWLIHYTIFDGETQEGSLDTGTLTSDVGTYADSGTSTHIVYKTYFPTFSPGVITQDQYIAIALYATTPSSGTALASPGLVMFDIEYNAASSPVEMPPAFMS